MEIDWALLIIDVQKDFCEGGALPAKDTLSLIEPLNDLMFWAVSEDILCVYTRDWHPKDHCSFISQGGPWPVHCVQDSYGAQFATGLVIPGSAHFIDIEKDSNKSNMSYSAFENTDLDKILKNRKISKLIVTGIATEYCVKATVLDALRFGFQVNLLTDLIRPINKQPCDSKIAIEDMRLSGANIMSINQFLNH